MKNKTKYTIYSVLYLILAIISMSLIDSSLIVFYENPDGYSFSFLAIVSFCWWQSISGMCRNILKIETEKLREEIEHAGKRED